MTRRSEESGSESRQSERRGRARRQGGIAARILAPFADIRADEATGALLMAAQAFVLLGVYYLIKPVRESWILPGGAEVKTYAAAAQAIALIFVARGYEALARRVRRDKLIACVTALASLGLVVFYVLAQSGADVGLAFFLWVGGFQLLLVAQFWAFASDVYTAEQGRRIFALLGAGAALGSVGGAQAARLAMRALETPAHLLPVAATILLIAPLLAVLAHHRQAPARREVDAPPPAEVTIPAREAEHHAPAIDARSVALKLLADPYLRLVALFTVLLNCASTVGEYALDRALLAEAQIAVATQSAASVEQYVGAFKADYYGAVNLLVLVLQLFAVSRLMRWGGERVAISLLPFVVLIGAMATMGAAVTGLLPVLGVLAIARLAESGVAHSIQSTARQSLFLVTSREAKWGGRAFIDTVTWRLGDVMGAVVVAIVAAAGGGAAHAAGVVFALACGWLWVVRSLCREHRERSGEPQVSLAALSQRSI